MTTWLESEARFRAADPTFKAWSDGQTEAYRKWDDQQLMNMLIFFPTGKGKTKTGLALLAERDYQHAIVIAPLKVQDDWKRDAAVLGMTLRVETVEKFRLNNTKYPKGVPIIFDEAHKLGGHTAIGWKKLNRMATGIMAPIILMSATPNYNDAERVFCLTAICDTAPNRNYLQWLYDTCNTTPNYFSAIPDVDEDHPFKGRDGGALEFLVDKPWCAYIEDDATWKAVSFRLPMQTDLVFEEYGYDSVKHRIMASDMEKRHRRVNKAFIDDDSFIRQDVWDEVTTVIRGYTNYGQWLIFCNHKTVAEALYRTSTRDGLEETFLITGDTKPEAVEVSKQAFIRSEQGVLIGTTTLAEGVDGLDKTCQALLILDDIEGDPSKRRQLIGRILPRGGDDGIERLVITATF